ncbi:hypothetical protein BS17DRAFT_788965, partial [Gyrodon lividus]
MGDWYIGQRSSFWIEFSCSLSHSMFPGGRPSTRNGRNTIRVHAISGRDLELQESRPILVNNRRHGERDWGNGHGHGLAPVFRVPERKRPTRADHTTISVPCRDGV